MLSQFKKHLFSENFISHEKCDCGKPEAGTARACVMGVQAWVARAHRTARLPTQQPPAAAFERDQASQQKTWSDCCRS